MEQNTTNAAAAAGGALFPNWVQNVFGSFAPVGAGVVAVILDLILPKDPEPAKK